MAATPLSAEERRLSAGDLQGRGIGERYPAPHQIRLAGDGEPAPPRKLPARNRDHAAAGMRPRMGNEPGMRAPRQAWGRAPDAIGRPVAAWVLIPVRFHLSTRVRLGPLLV